ncbi:DJ-1/PfpI family protein [Saccharopolyspora tripterygii]
MQVAIALYDEFTALDAIGPYEVLANLPGAEVVLVGERTEPVHNGARLKIVPEATFDEVPRPDIVVVPGGNHHAQLPDGPVVRWLRRVDATTTWTTSVCTGSLLLGAAGLLAGRRATSHWIALDQLPAFGATPTGQRVVFDGKHVTAAGVSSGIDMALALVARIAGEQVAQGVQLGIEYDPQPPFDSGAPDKAPPEVREFVDARLRPVVEGRATA